MSRIDDIINIYQEMVRDQVYDFINSKNKDFIIYRLYYFDNCTIPITYIEKNGYRYEFQRKALDKNIVDELIRRGLLIKVGYIDGVDIYTTLHADVVFRVLRGRAFEDHLDGRWVGYYDIEIKNEYMPKFSAVDIDKLKDKLNQFFKNNGVDDKLAKTLSEVIADGLKESGFRSIAKWQYEAISYMLSELMTSETSRHYVITAPTAAGKTLVFQVVAISYILLQKVLSRSSSFEGYSRVLILYPRKALQNQQLERLLKPLHFINKKLKEKSITDITVAIDRGVEHTDTKITPGTEFDTGIRCPHAEEHTIKIRYEDRGILRQEIVCSDGLKLNYITGIVYEKRDRNVLAAYNPDILISNPWTLKFRLLSPQSGLRDLYRLRGLVILDEAHVYANVSYIDLIASIRLHYNIRRVENLGPTIVIAASATIHLNDPRTLLSWILGIEENDVEHIDYSRLEPHHRERQRLKIIVTLLPYRLSLETTLQGVVQVILTATSNNNLKSIVFVDSISEASTIMGYLDTILIKRNSVEICDHISSKPCRENQDDILSIRPSLNVNNVNYFDDYSWGHYISIKPNGMRVKDLLNYLKKLINFVGLHHGALSEEERKELESDFATGSKKLLISTSTLDLGMDYDDVTFIVQYKEPLSGEALEQRIGRAGRKDEAARISLAFYLPTVTPSLLQKIFGKKAKDEETVVLPDESNIAWHYLVQVLEYEIIQALRDLINTSKHRSLSTIKRGLLNTLYEYLTKNGFEKLTNKWLNPSERKKLKLEITIPILHIKNIDRGIEEIIRGVWQKLRDLDLVYKRHLNKAYYEKKIKEKIKASGIPRAIISEDEITDLSHELKRMVKKYIEDFVESIELCENIQDLEYNLDLIRSRVDQCISLLGNSLKEIKEEVESYKRIMELINEKLIGVAKARKVEVREWLKYALLVEELGSLLSDLDQYLKELNEYLESDEYITMFYTSLIMSKPIRSRYHTMKRCKKCEVNEITIGKCWYNCLRHSMVLALYSARSMHPAFREYETIGLDIIR